MKHVPKASHTFCGVRRQSTGAAASFCKQLSSEAAPPSSHFSCQAGAKVGTKAAPGSQENASPCYVSENECLLLWCADKALEPLPASASSSLVKHPASASSSLVKEPASASSSLMKQPAPASRPPVMQPPKQAPRRLPARMRVQPPAYHEG